MIGIVVGLEAEAKLARRWGVPVAVGGGGPDGAARAAETLAPTVRGLISFGLAGALDPALRPGTLLVPTRIVDGGEAWDTDPALNRALGGSTPHTLLGGGAILATPEQKRQAHASTAAHAVDLESAAVARAATRHGLPFAAVRAICDGAGRTLPHAALVALTPTGRIAPWRIIAAALARPGEIPTLIALARDAANARQALVARIRATPRLCLVL